LSTRSDCQPLLSHNARYILIITSVEYYTPSLLLYFYSSHYSHITSLLILTWRSTFQINFEQPNVCYHTPHDSIMEGTPRRPGARLPPATHTEGNLQATDIEQVAHISRAEYRPLLPADDPRHPQVRPTHLAYNSSDPFFGLLLEHLPFDPSNTGATNIMPPNTPLHGGFPIFNQNMEMLQALQGNGPMNAQQANMLMQTQNQALLSASQSTMLNGFQGPVHTGNCQTHLSNMCHANPVYAAQIRNVSSIPSTSWAQRQDEHQFGRNTPGSISEVPFPAQFPPPSTPRQFSLQQQGDQHASRPSMSPSPAVDLSTHTPLQQQFHHQQAQQMIQQRLNQQTPNRSAAQSRTSNFSPMATGHKRQGEQLVEPARKRQGVENTFVNGQLRFNVPAQSQQQQIRRNTPNCVFSGVTPAQQAQFSPSIEQFQQQLRVFETQQQQQEQLQQLRQRQGRLHLQQRQQQQIKGQSKQLQQDPTIRRLSVPLSSAPLASQKQRPQTTRSPITQQSAIHSPAIKRSSSNVGTLKTTIQANSTPPNRPTSLASSSYHSVQFSPSIQEAQQQSYEDASDRRVSTGSPTHISPPAMSSLGSPLNPVQIPDDEDVHADHEVSPTAPSTLISDQVPATQSENMTIFERRVAKMLSEANASSPLSSGHLESGVSSQERPLADNSSRTSSSPQTRPQPSDSVHVSVVPDHENPSIGDPSQSCLSSQIPPQTTDSNTINHQQQTRTSSNGSSATRLNEALERWLDENLPPGWEEFADPTLIHVQQPLDAEKRQLLRGTWKGDFMPDLFLEFDSEWTGGVGGMID
jgi:hypothetical protein